MKTSFSFPLARTIWITSLITLLSGCAQNNLSPSGSDWHENDALNRDLAAQLANPADLVKGHGDATVPAQALVAAIESWSAKPAESPGTTSGSTFGGAGFAGTP